MVRRTVGGAVVVLAVVVSGCGGGSSATAVSSFRNQANGICTRFVKQQSRLPQPGLTSSMQDIANYISAIESSVSQEVGQLAALKPPASERSTFNAALDAARQDLTQTRSTFGNVDHMSLTELATAESSAVSAGKALTQKFAAAGLTSCTSPFSSP